MNLMAELQSIRARHLRTLQTDAEQALWERLRNWQLADSKFRRQHVVGRYIVDFVCLEKKLVVEIDGSQHIDQQLYDQQRTRYLVSKGFKVIRFWNDEVLKQLDNVVEVIHSRLIDINPHPSPLPFRERGQRKEHRLAI